MKAQLTGKLSVGIAGVILLSACASSVPTGPSVAVMPAQGKPFEVFEQDHLICKDFASREIGLSADASAQTEMVKGAATGAVVGAAAGVLLGDSSNAAAAGAGVGALMGTAVGAGNAQQLGGNLQRRYNIAYQQCMYAKGNQLPQSAPSSYYQEVITTERYPARMPPPARFPPPPRYR